MFILALYYGSEGRSFSEPDTLENIYKTIQSGGTHGQKFKILREFIFLPPELNNDEEVCNGD